MLDSLSIKTAMFSIRKTDPDAVECLPPIIPRVFSEMVHEVNSQLLQGLLKHPCELVETLRSGVRAVSISNQKFWSYSIDWEDYDNTYRIL